MRAPGQVDHLQLAAALQTAGWRPAGAELGPSCLVPPLTLLLCKEGENQATGGPAQPSLCLQQPEPCAASQPGQNHQASSLTPSKSCAPQSLLPLMKSGNENHIPLRLRGALHRERVQPTAEASSSPLKEGRQRLFLVQKYQAPLVNTEGAQIAEAPRPAPAWPP